MSHIVIDLPGDEQRKAILEIYLEQFALDRKQRKPSDAGWTGAEIRACCRLAALLDVPLIQAAQNIVPISSTSGESVQRLRQWASGRCLSADYTGTISTRREGERAAATSRGILPSIDGRRSPHRVLAAPR